MRFVKSIVPSEDSFDIYQRSLKDEDIRRLVAFSKDQDVRFTSDADRFATIETAIDFIDSNTLTFYVLEHAGKLTGIIWYHSLKNPLGIKGWDISYAIRLYGCARGKGLSAEFTRATLEHFVTTDHYRLEPSHDVWLSVHKDNVPAIKSYLRCGFEEEAELGSRIIMLLGV